MIYARYSSAGQNISTHAPAGGATRQGMIAVLISINFYSRPCGRGDRPGSPARRAGQHFYSRPCGRGDAFSVSR